MEVKRPRRFTGLVATLVIVGCAAFGAGQQGTRGAASALIGGVIAVVFLGSTRAVLGPMVSALPHASLATSLLFYLTKVTALVALFVVLQDLALPAGPLDGGALAGTVIVTTLGWLVTRTIDDARARIPIFDLPDEPNSPPDKLGEQ